MHYSEYAVNIISSFGYIILFRVCLETIDLSFFTLGFTLGSIGIDISLQYHFTCEDA